MVSASELCCLEPKERPHWVPLDRCHYLLAPLWLAEEASVSLWSVTTELRCVRVVDTWREPSWRGLWQVFTGSVSIALAVHCGGQSKADWDLNPISVAFQL